MTEKKYLISRKLNVLDFAYQTNNISKACRRLGISRQHYYDIKNTLAEEGVKGLMEKTRRVARLEIVSPLKMKMPFWNTDSMSRIMARNVWRMKSTASTTGRSLMVVFDPSGTVMASRPNLCV